MGCSLGLSGGFGDGFGDAFAIKPDDQAHLFGPLAGNDCLVGSEGDLAAGLTTPIKRDGALIKGLEADVFVADSEKQLGDAQRPVAFA